MPYRAKIKSAGPAPEGKYHNIVLVDKGYILKNGRWNTMIIKIPGKKTIWYKKNTPDKFMGVCSKQHGKWYCTEPVKMLVMFGYKSSRKIEYKVIASKDLAFILDNFNAGPPPPSHLRPLGMALD